MYYDERSTTYSDYSFIIKNLPQKTKVKSSINKLLSNYRVVDIIVVGAFDDI